MSARWAVLGAVLLVIVAIIAVQNTEVVETTVLFLKVPLPRAILIFASAGLGFAAGAVLIKRSRPTDPDTPAPLQHVRRDRSHKP